MNEMFRGSTAVVTGGASGIGLSLARALVTQGARVAIADVSLEASVAAAASLGAGARGYRCDVTEREDLRELAQNVQQDFGGAQFVFANAGVLVIEPLHKTKPEEFDWLMDVNVRGAFNTVHAFVPQLMKNAAAGRPARFVFTGSENSVGLPFEGIMTAYTATKHAVMALADGLRRDLQDSGVGVTIFCPGPVNTGIWDARRSRQTQYGGAELAEDKFAEAMTTHFKQFVHPDSTAQLCLDGMINDEFIVITDRSMRAFAQKRHAEVEAALDRLDARLQGSSS